MERFLASGIHWLYWTKSSNFQGMWPPHPYLPDTNIYISIHIFREETFLGSRCWNENLVQCFAQIWMWTLWVGNQIMTHKQRPSLAFWDSLWEKGVLLDISNCLTKFHKEMLFINSPEINMHDMSIHIHSSALGFTLFK